MSFKLTVDNKFPEPKITEKSFEVFMAYAKDAANWSGQPLVGGNVGGSKSERGNLTQLKKAGLITTSQSHDLGVQSWVSFTEAGQELAAQHGVDLGEYEPQSAGQQALRDSRKAAAEEIIDELKDNGRTAKLRSIATGKVVNARVITSTKLEVTATPIRVKTGATCGKVTSYALSMWTLEGVR